MFATADPAAQSAGGGAVGQRAGGRWAGAVAVASSGAVLVVLLVLVGRPLATDDLWWHIKLGETYASQGPWVEADPLYHTTEGRPTIPHEWLFQAGVYGLDQAVGFQGLRVVHVLAVGALAAWAFALLRGAAGSLAPAALATSVLLVLSWFRLFQFRPDLVSVLALFALYGLLLAAERPPSRGRVALACLVFAVWANMHSLYAIGLALLLAALMGVGLRRLLLRSVGRSIDERGEASSDAALARGLALALLATAVATLANPRGPEALTLFFVESASGDIWHLQDDFLPWNPFWPASDNLALTPLCWLLAGAVAAAFGATALRGGLRVLRERSAAAVRDLDTVHLGLGAAALVAMLVSVRFHWLAFLPLVYLLRALRRGCAGAPARARRASAAAALAGLALAALFPGSIHAGAFAREVAAEPRGYASPYLDERYCGSGVRFLADTGMRGRLFHPFNLGGFLGYWLAPDLRTFIDGRMDHYPTEVLDDYLKIRHASQAGAGRILWTLLDKWKIDVFFGTSFPESAYSDRFWIAHIRRLPVWVPVWASQTHSIYVRRDNRNARNLTLAKAWWIQRNVPFATKTGVDMDAAIDRRPAWVVKQGIVPPDHERLLADRDAPDPAVRRAALARLGRAYWQIGAFEKQVAADTELVALAPEDKDARLRLADGLLHQDRPRQALEVARALHDEDPEFGDVALILALARKQVREPPAAPGA